MPDTETPHTVKIPTPFKAIGDVQDRPGGGPEHWIAIGTNSPFAFDLTFPGQMPRDHATAITDYVVMACNAHEALVAALQAAEQFIKNGVEFGYITMPDANDPAHEAH